MKVSLMAPTIHSSAGSARSCNVSAGLISELETSLRLDTSWAQFCFFPCGVVDRVRHVFVLWWLQFKLRPRQFIQVRGKLAPSSSCPSSGSSRLHTNNRLITDTALFDLPSRADVASGSSLKQYGMISFLFFLFVTMTRLPSARFGGATRIQHGSNGFSLTKKGTKMNGLTNCSWAYYTQDNNTQRITQRTPHTDTAHRQRETPRTHIFSVFSQTSRIQRRVKL